ncbi:hypothetical protein HDU93_000251 [Gonapodya sp. JEL0774]|nr:hypothetical protein HDU93_000251 [Gonapodya sp. JEL0774]
MEATSITKNGTVIGKSAQSSRAMDPRRDGKVVMLKKKRPLKAHLSDESNEDGNSGSAQEGAVDSNSSDGENDFPSRKKLKAKVKKAKVLVEPGANVANAINSILSQKTVPIAKDRPILSAFPHLEHRIDAAKADAKAARALAAQRKERKLIGRVTGVALATGDEEKKLKRIATRGVVKLFNAIRQAQSNAPQGNRSAADAVEGDSKHISRSAFLALLGGPATSNTLASTTSNNSSRAPTTSSAAAAAAGVKEERWSVFRDEQAPSFKDWDKAAAVDGEDEEEEDERVY